MLVTSINDLVRGVRPTVLGSFDRGIFSGEIMSEDYVQGDYIPDSCRRPSRWLLTLLHRTDPRVLCLWQGTSNLFEPPKVETVPATSKMRY